VVDRIHRRLERIAVAHDPVLIVVWRLRYPLGLIQLVMQAVHERRKGVQFPMYVFTAIDAAWPQVPQQLLEAYNLLLGQMAAVVYDDIEDRHRLAKFAPELAVSLVADEDLHLAALIDTAGRFDIDAIDMHFGTKIVAPHVQTSAAINADFKEVNLLIAKPVKMTVVNIEVVEPLPNAGAFGAVVEKIPQPVGARLCRVPGYGRPRKSGVVAPR